MTKNYVFVLGIDGLGGAGKTTLCEVLEKELQKKGFDVLILHIDDFITKRCVRYNKQYPEWECYYYLQWRYDYFGELIEKLKKQHKEITYEIYLKEDNLYQTVINKIKYPLIVIVEGVFLQRKEIRHLFDCVAYLDVDEQERLNRVLQRDTYIGNNEAISLKYEKRYFPAEHVYVDTSHPKENADIVIGGNEDALSLLSTMWKFIG